jgi:hypothetical protein
VYARMYMLCTGIMTEAVAGAVAVSCCYCCWDAFEYFVLQYACLQIVVGVVVFVSRTTCAASVQAC